MCPERAYNIAGNMHISQMSPLKILNCTFSTCQEGEVISAQTSFKSWQKAVGVGR
jgi:hypothetical protein